MKSIALALALLAGTAAALPASAQVVLDGEAAFRATTLTLSSHGEAGTAPDQATISLGVTTEALTAADALAQNRSRMNAVVQAVRAQGVLERDIQTSGLNLNPQYAHVERQAPRITGYQVSNQVTLTVRDLSKLGPTIDAVVRVGANQINGINFGLQNVDAASDQARATAVRNLQTKAELYARATGLRIVRLVNLSESGGYQPRPYPMPMMRASAASMDAATNIQPGEVQVRVDVTATYELAR
jgi:hypothetical protein